MKWEEKFANYFASVGFIAMFGSFWFEKTLAIFMTGVGMILWAIMWVLDIKKKEKENAKN